MQSSVFLEIQLSIVELSSRGPLLHTLADRCHLDETLRSSIGT
ncbi:hypothetical protein [Planktothrix agardhii]|nr:hypothetical protein [Planktothrix agardhii]